METRANHVVIGIFVLAVVAAFFGFVIWLAKVEIDAEFDAYAITFKGAVSGLSPGAAVNYNGIPVGNVASLDIDPDDPSQVRVVVELKGGTPIREDTVAALELQGITGLSVIQLTGGSSTSAMLEAGADGQLPEIPSKQSALQELFAGAPALIQRITLLVADVSKLLNEDNRASIGNILHSTDVLLSGLASREDELHAIVTQLNEGTREIQTLTNQINILLRDFSKVAKHADTLVQTTDGVINGDLSRLLRDLQQTNSEVNKLASHANSIVEDNREAIDVFASEGLVQFTKFIEETRFLVGSSTRLVEDLQSDPTRFFFGRQKGGVEAE